MAKVQTKKKESSASKVSLSDPQTESASSSTSPGDASRCGNDIWPEWNDLEVSEEKWDLSKVSEDSKKNKSPNDEMGLFEDPEGKVSLPPSLKVHSWKRPTEFIVNKRPIVVKRQTAFDLFSRNDHLMCSEMMRRIISEIYIAWTVLNNTVAKKGRWRPWEHIYSLCKVEKGHLPLYNSFGKYEIRLYWMGGWKKITVDDLMPFDEENNLLLPASTCQSELWPMLLAKALIKVANTSVKSDRYEEMGEYTFLHNFTGWITKITPITTSPSDLEETWAVLQDTLPKFVHPDETKPQTAYPAAGRNDSKSKLRESAKSKGTHEALVCASFFNLDPSYWNFSRETADSSHALRQNGLCLMHSHIVLLKRTRTCPLEAPPKPQPIPRWKLIRPKKKKVLPTSEPQKIPVVKPLQFIEIASPFLNNRGKSSAGRTPKQEEDKQGAKKKRFRGSPLLPIGESEKTEYRQCLEPDAAECTADSPNSTTDKTEVTAKDSKKDNADISNGSPQLSVEEPVMEEPSAPATPTLRETWVHLEDFVKCFQTLLVFHKPEIYPHHAKSSHFKRRVLYKPAVMTNFPGSSTHSTGSFPETCSVSDTKRQMLCEKVYMCVESVQPIQILIGFSVLNVWGNEAKDTAKESKDAARQKRMHRMAEEGSGDVSVAVHWWKSRRLQEHFVFFRTTSSKADVFKLPPGRHVLVVLGAGPLGFNVHVCSKTPFVFGDEDTVMPHLSKESIRFTEQASSILSALTRVVSSFSDEQDQPAARRLLEEAHCPQNISTTLEKDGHRKVFNFAVYNMLCEALGRKLSSEERFAVLALTADPSLLATYPEEHSARPDAESNPPESWRDREPTDEEVKAATVLQAGFKGHSVREILNASKPGTKENLNAAKILLTMWPKVVSDADKHAILLLRFIIDHPERKAELYPCQQDEYTKVSFADYCGSIPDTNRRPWLLVLREVFMVPKEMLMMAKVYSSNPVNPLYIINNDTGEDMHNICNKEGSCIYQPNKLGYTFAAGVRPYEPSLAGAKYKLRLIGSRELPKLSYETPLSVKEIQDYYFPQDDNIICRYFVQVTEDVMGTIQFYTSEPNVQIRLSILDQEKEVVSKTGMGYVDFPVFRFEANKDEKDQNQKGSSPTKGTGVKMEDTPQKRDEEDGAAGESNPSSDQNQPPTDEKDQVQNQKGKPHTKGTGVKVEDTPQKRDEEDGAVEGSDPSSDQNQPPTETTGHKYLIQAEVLHNSWYLDESQLAFVQVLKELRDKEIGERIEEVSTLSTDSEPQHQSDTARTNRKVEGDKEKGKSAATMPVVLQSLDLTKANWTLIVISNKSKEESIEVTKDTEKLDRMIAVWRGWELEDPGRRARGIETHNWYLQQDNVQNDDRSFEGRVKYLTRNRRKRDPDSMSPFMKSLWEKVQPQRLEQEKRREQEEQEWQQYRNNVREQSNKRVEKCKAQREESNKRLAESWANLKEYTRVMTRTQEENPAPEEAQQAVVEEAPAASAPSQKSKKHAKGKKN